MATYQIWLCDAWGKRLTQIENWAYFSYTRTTQGFGTIQFAVPLEYIQSRVDTYFLPDFRLDVWRSPAVGVPLRRECSFLLRKVMVYQRQEDNVTIVEYIGRNGLDLLNRATIEASTLTLSDKIDKLMYQLVLDDVPNIANQAAYYSSFLRIPDIDNYPGVGPTITDEVPYRNVLDTFKDWKALSFSYNKTDPTNRRIYFDVVEIDQSDGSFCYEFRAYPDRRGTDRTSGVVFSVENGNLKSPRYTEDYQDILTRIAIYANVDTPSADVTYLFTPDAYLSPVNFCSKIQVITTTDPTNVPAALANKLAGERRPEKTFSGIFVNSPGGPTQPRSLYGLDWDMGDILPVKFAGKTFDAEVVIVYVSVNDKGQEDVIGRTEVGT